MNRAGVFENPVTSGDGGNFEQLEEALALLLEAGFTLDGSTLLTPEGEPFTIELLNYSVPFERVWQAYGGSLALLGIRLELKVVDSGVWIEALRNRDFEVVAYAFSGFETPGDDIRAFFSTTMSDTPGSLGFAGVRDPFVDELYKRAKASEDLSEIEAYGRVFDRHMRNQNYNILFCIPTLCPSAVVGLLWPPRRFGHPRAFPRRRLNGLVAG